MNVLKSVEKGYFSSHSTNLFTEYAYLEMMDVFGQIHDANNKFSLRHKNVIISLFLHKLSMGY